MQRTHAYEYLPQGHYGIYAGSTVEDMNLEYLLFFLTEHMVTYMQVTGTYCPCMCGRMYAWRNAHQNMCSALVYTSIHRKRIIADATQLNI